MNTESLPTLPAEIPRGFFRLAVSAGDMDYLRDHWGLTDHGEIFGWAVKMLADLSKLDEAGWRLTLTKCEIDETTRQISHGKDHAQLYALMKWLAPTSTGFPRLPTAGTLDEIMKIKKAQE